MPNAQSERTQQILRVLVAISFAAFGIQHLVYRDFVTRVAPTLPAWIPWQPLWACLVGVALIAAAIALVMKKRTIVLLLSGGCLGAALLLHLPRALASLQNIGLWIWFGKGLTLAGTASVVTATLSADSRVRDRLILFGKYSLGGFMILCGYLHLTAVTAVASIIPSWIPWPIFCTYFAGAALIGGGLGMMVPFTTRLATYLSGVMILAWVPLIHMPRALHDLSDSNETTSNFEALAFGSMAVLAALTSDPNQRDRSVAQPAEHSLIQS